MHEVLVPAPALYSCRDQVRPSAAPISATPSMPRERRRNRRKEENKVSKLVRDLARAHHLPPSLAEPPGIIGGLVSR